MGRNDAGGSRLSFGTGVLGWPGRLTDVSSWHGHIPFATWCIEALRPRVLVELGTHKGDSYCAMCEAVEGLRVGTRVRRAAIGCFRFPIAGRGAGDIDFLLSR